MASNPPSAPPIDDGSFYEVEIENTPYDHNFAIHTNLLVEINDNVPTTCNKRVILHRILYLLFLSSLTFIIYEHHEIIGIYLNKIGDIF